MNSWVVWGIRFAFSLVGTALVAWYISFSVADYVVKANTSSANEAMQALQSSIDRLNETTIVNNAQLATINNQITALTSASATQGQEIQFIRGDVAKIQEAVESHGINIKAQYDAIKMNQMDFSNLREIYSVPSGKTVHWNMVPVLTDSN